MEPGNVVLLNGTSRAGKTTTAKALQRIMETPYVHMGNDPFLACVPEQCFGTLGNSDASPADYFVLVYKGPAERTVMELEWGQTVFGRGELAGVRIGTASSRLMALHESLYPSLVDTVELTV